jgi:transcriptional regulator with XRE-family HTH domain
MRNFGETVRNLRSAQSLGLRETAFLVGISPAYLSRIERNKENPPKPEIIKKIAKVLAADPDVLFRLSSNTDPDLVEFLHDSPAVLSMIRYIQTANFNEQEIQQIYDFTCNLRDE